MTLISDEDRDHLKDHFLQHLKYPVTILLFTQRDSALPVPSIHAQECLFCRETRQLLEEVAELSDVIRLEVHDFVAERELAESHRVDKIPAALVLGNGRNGVRFFGIPSGYEFPTLVESIVDVSRGTTDLSPRIREAIAGLGKVLHLQVFVTPT